MKERPRKSECNAADFTNETILKELTKILEHESSSTQTRLSSTSKHRAEAEQLRGRLNPILTEVWSKLPEAIQLQLKMLMGQQLLHQSTFKEIVFATYEAILPRETRKLTVSTVLSMHRLGQGLSDLAQKMDCLELKRALHRGLALDMARRGVLDVEGTAWVVAVCHGLGRIFNVSQSLSGYRDALRSVKRARIGKRKDVDGMMDARGISVQKLAPAMLEYWLPLGLWAMSVEDALECLRLFTLPAVVSRTKGTTRAEVEQILPASFQPKQSEALKIKPKERTWHSRFSSAVCDKELYRAPSPMISLRYTGTSQEGRSDPEQWTFNFLPGFDCAGRW